MIQQPSNGRTYATVALLSLTAALGCRGNLGGALAVATGRANVQSLQQAAAFRAASQAGVDQSGVAAVQQTSFSPRTPATSAGLFPAIDPVTGNPATPPTREQAMAAILPELQRLGAVNPATQQQLIAQMQTVEPALWPALVRRARADLAVNQQLNNPSPSQVTPAQHHHDGHGHHHGSGNKPFPNQASRTESLPPAPWINAIADSPPRRDFAVQQVAHTEAVSHFAPPPNRPAGRSLARRSALDDEQRTLHAAFNTADFDAPESSEPTARLLSAHSPAPAPKVIHNPMFEGSTAAQLTWRDALQHAIEDLHMKVPSRPQSADESYQHARLRLMQLAAGDIDSASVAIPGLTSTEQSYWSHQLFALSRLMDEQTQPDTKRRAAAANLHLAAAATKLEQLSSLAVRRLTFCKKIYGFGDYDAVDDPAFRPGDLVQLYAEVRHYLTKANNDGLHEASFNSSYTIRDLDGRPMISRDFTPVFDACQSPRRDFYIDYTVELPKRIKPGVYHLEILVEDQFSQKKGHASVDFTVVDSAADRQRLVE